ncbi:MAG: hypothetical protein QM766_05365 [Burkholderiaceae bacterium]
MSRDEGRSGTKTAALGWPDIASRFHVISAGALLEFDHLPRHQDLCGGSHWLRPDDPPLALLFVSHRWETLEKPDPQGRHHAAIRAFVQRIAVVARAMMSARIERIDLVPAIDREGDLQAHALLRRMLGQDPLGGASCLPGPTLARRELSRAFERSGGDAGRFDAWLATRIGVWVDYCCMPQRPFAQDDEAEFRQTLRELDTLVASSTLVALRDAGDDYPVRGWCASEFFLASEHSFARGLFVDIERLLAGRRVAVPEAPAAKSTNPMIARVIAQSYRADRSAWQQAIDYWTELDGDLVRNHAPDAWGPYRSLQGSGFFDSASDPNPFRRVLDAIKALETALLHCWLMSDRPRTIDAGRVIGSFVEGAGLSCSRREDLHYLGFTIACRGWVDTFRTFGRACLQRYVDGAELSSSGVTWPSVIVTLHPPDASLRALFAAVSPASPETWRARLSSSARAATPQERAVIGQVAQALAERPPRFELHDVGDGGYGEPELTL